jgi:hypothetical protein
MTPEGEVNGPSFQMEPRSRCTVEVAATVQNNWSVSTKVTADQPVVAERSMYWNTPSTARQAANDSIGVTAPSTNWYLAEGSTGANSYGGFETWVLLQNPGLTRATARITYMTERGAVPSPCFGLNPGTRRSVSVADTVPNDFDVSVKVDSTVPVVAERSVYWNTPGTNRQASHASIGTAHPSKTWYLAEGSTWVHGYGGFETWVLLQNPGGQAANAKLFYQTPDGETAGPELSLPPRTRRTVRVSDTVPNNFSVSTRVLADRPVIAERSMYWSTPEVFRQAAHYSIGVTVPEPEWLLAEGSTGIWDAGSFDTWVLVQNPGDRSAGIEITYMTPSGSVAGPKTTLEPKTRRTFSVSDSLKDAWSVSIKVTSDETVIAERVMYWNAPGQAKRCAHDSIGFAP